MPSMRQLSRIDTTEIKFQIFKKLGRQKAEKYFYNLKRLLNLKLSKLEFDKLCYMTIGKENLALHNMLIRSILGNAYNALGPPSKETMTGHSRSTKVSSSSDTLPSSSRRGRSTNSRDRRQTDRPSPLGPYGKMPPGHVQEVANSSDLQRLREQQNAPELISIGSKALLDVGSVEDGEEVEQNSGSPSVQSRSPLRAPLGIPMNVGSRKSLSSSLSGFQLLKPNTLDICLSTSELPDTRTLKQRLERKLKAEGIGFSVDCANLLNHGLDAFLKRLAKPCLDLARSRSVSRKMSQENMNNFTSASGVRQANSAQILNQSYFASLLDFRVAMESNPQLLGADWPLKLEKISFRSSE